MDGLMSAFERKRFDFALRMATLAGIIGFILAIALYDRSNDVLLFFDFSDNRVANERTIGQLCAALTIAITLIYCLISYRLYTTERDDVTDVERIAIRGRSNWIGRVTISLVVTTMYSVVAWLGFAVLGLMFKDLRFPYMQALFLTASYSAALGFYISRWAVGLTTSGIVWLGLLTFAAGLMGSFLLADDPEWWRNSLSYLGYDSGSDTLFRISVISVGLMMLTLLRDLMNTMGILVEANKLTPIAHRILSTGAVVACCGIIGVGLFPVRVNVVSDTLHNLSVYAAGGVFISGMLGIRFITQHVFHPFFDEKLSWRLAALVIFLYILHIGPGMINFVALEIFSFAIFSIWIYYLNEYTLLYLREQDEAIIREAAKRAQEHSEFSWVVRLDQLQQSNNLHKN